MKISELKNELIGKVMDACIRHMAETEAEFPSKNVFSYAIYCSSGCRNIGVALCTRRGLQLRNKKAVANSGEPVWYGEVNAAEWDHINEHYMFFSEVNEYIDCLYEFFYEEELEEIDLDNLNKDELWNFISDFFVDAVVKSVAKLRASSFFEKPVFEKDVLLGLQFDDPDHYSISMIEQASQELNSSEWHKKIKANCDLLRKAA